MTLIVPFLFYFLDYSAYNYLYEPEPEIIIYEMSDRPPPASPYQ